jgi:peptide chain release factor 3
MSNPWAQEIDRRRTFAIISHPDAGKTTLTEKLLLFGGAVREAGAVKARRQQAPTRSDWMEIERKRGISVTSTVLQFDVDGYRVNLLDTPGHEDFSEDTYRTLLAADSAVMVLDGAKGVESQTEQLFRVCHRRRLPIVTFINKWDRDTKDPWDLLDDIERRLDLKTYPMNWPVGVGPSFRGLYDRRSRLFEPYNHHMGALPSVSWANASLDPDERAALDSAIELLDLAGERWDAPAFQHGELTPVYFGSAMANFGVHKFLQGFLALASKPADRLAEHGLVSAHDPYFSGFVFKIQANMNPLHRDRMAFIRICSGRYERDLAVIHSPSGRKIRLSAAQRLFGQERELVETAYAGDIIGVLDTAGLFSIGDSVSTRPNVRFTRFPRFSPERFAALELKHAMKHKQYQRGLDQLVQEGVIQRFRPVQGGLAVVLGTVGPLQFDVFSYRMQSEYGVEVTLTPLPYTVARWVREGPESLPLGRFDRVMETIDDRGQRVLLFEDRASVDRLCERIGTLILQDSNETEPAQGVMP